MDDACKSSSAIDWPGPPPSPSAPVLFRFTKVLSIIACVYLAGGHWALLQTTAWVGMLADYSRSYGVEKAVAMTFDGEHPCAMCCKIAAAKKRESSPDLPAENLRKIEKKDPLVPLGKRLSLRSPVFSLIAPQTVHFVADTRRETPPLPPPRNPVA